MPSAESRKVDSINYVGLNAKDIKFCELLDKVIDRKCDRTDHS